MYSVNTGLSVHLPVVSHTLGINSVASSRAKLQECEHVDERGIRLVDVLQSQLLTDSFIVFYVPINE
ncbi:hypothetical protein V1477_015745 [Vespula maculifrons]|uniref:Uncharacterized protein n=1 Tax=Vespula maculifrons TaxID=7453 RepID=A0ABD2BB25_VESMC